MNSRVVFRPESSFNLTDQSEGSSTRRDRLASIVRWRSRPSQTNEYNSALTAKKMFSSRSRAQSKKRRSKYCVDSTYTSKYPGEQQPHCATRHALRTQA